MNTACHAHISVLFYRMQNSSIHLSMYRKLPCPKTDVFLPNIRKLLNLLQAFSSKSVMLYCTTNACQSSASDSGQDRALASVFWIGSKSGTIAIASPISIENLPSIIIKVPHLKISYSRCSGLLRCSNKRAFVFSNIRICCAL